MDLFRRKLWGDRVTWLGVAAASIFVVARYIARPTDLFLYILIGWGLVVGWLVFFSELRLGRRRPGRGKVAMFIDWATYVGEERLDPDGTRHRGFVGTVAGVMSLEPTGVRWRPRSPDTGLDEVLFSWADVYSWRLVGVLPLIGQASGYLVLTVFGGRELVYHVHNVRRWRRAMREGMIVGPTHAAPAFGDSGSEGLPVGGAEERPPGPPSGLRPEPVGDFGTPETGGGGPGSASGLRPEPVGDSGAQETAAGDAVAVGEQAYEPVIGIECHVELATASKMFCGCPTGFGAEPNTHTCPVCTGQPGSLPVPNRGAIEHAIRIALALECTITDTSYFHRKNYFYPDMPKNYQISQYDVPLATAGRLGFEFDGVAREVGIHRVHIEEDTGKTMHAGEGGRIGEGTGAMIDYNRAGIPLVEIVTEPEITTPEDARAYVAELRTLLLALGVSDVRMEEGSLRCDANVSVRPVGTTDLGTKTEVKNMNSLRSVQRALAFEIERQVSVKQRGGEIVQETRHFDESSGQTIGGRAKEYSSDYRYFQDPDLVPLAPSPSWIDEIRATIGELPAARRLRFVSVHDLSDVDARTLTASGGLADAFEAAVAAYGGDAKAMARWYLGELAQLANERGVEAHEVGVGPEQVAELQRLVDDGKVTLSSAKSDVLAQVVETGKAPAVVVEESGLAQIADTDELTGLVDEAIASNPSAVEQFRGGKEGAINALIGEVMKATKGQAKADVVRELLLQRL